jgi:hypothetical protein
MATTRRYRCRLCGLELTAWIPVLDCLDSARLLHHLGQAHPGQAAAYLDRMQTEDDIDRVLLEDVFEAVDAPA